MTAKETGTSNPRSEFVLEGNITFQESQGEHLDLGIKVFAFDQLGVSLGSAELDAKGNFRIALRLRAPADIEVMAGPGTDAMSVRQSSAFLQSFSAKDWKKEGTRYAINPRLVIQHPIWWPWRPVRICVAGHVRKVNKQEGHTQICPVPFVKVEIFDVDREACWWPPLRNWWDMLLDRPVVRIPDLLKPRFSPQPFPGPDPAPEFRLDTRLLGKAAFSPGAEVSLTPQPEPPHQRGARMAGNAAEKPRVSTQVNMVQLPDASRVGEARLMDAAIASRLDRLTLTSKIPPWAIFPRCFYSKQLVCETYTDCDGYFRCCFRWSPLHLRNGRLRFDGRPDIIVRVTQIINGVSTVIYMDPYTSTRWDVTNAHLDLYLDNEEVRCGQGCHPTPEGSPVFFSRIGLDEVYQINQGTGLYADATYSKMAYGGNLLVFVLFGDALASGAPKRYYRLSYARQGSADADFKLIDANLIDTRVDKLNPPTSSDYFLGPQQVNGTTTLYEVRNRNDYYWLNLDWIGSWWTPPVEEDTATYILRLELFDENGVHLKTASGLVDYRDGTVTPPAVLPPMIDHCDLVITLDNKPAVVNVDIPAVLNECGVIPWSPALTLSFNVRATQENHRLYSWRLEYTKGVNPAVTYLDGDSSSSGALSPVSVPPVSGAPLLVGLTSTCAFALKLYAWAHIRNGYGFVYYTEQIKAIAIEKCAPCPECQGNVIV